MELEKFEQNEFNDKIKNEEQSKIVPEKETINQEKTKIQDFETLDENPNEQENLEEDIKPDYPLTIGNDEYEAGYPRTIGDDEFEEGHPKETDEEIGGETIDHTRKKYKFYTDGYIFSFLVIFFAVFSSFIFVFNYLFHPIKVVGKSMQPTINNNIYYQEEDDDTHCDIVYYMKADSYNTNDIVIVMNNDNKYISKTSGNEVSSVIKRVIGKPGQSIRFYLLRVDSSIEEEPKYYYNIEVFDKNGENINLDQSYLDEEKEMYFTNQELFYFSRPDNQNYKLFYDIFKEVAYDISHEYIYTVEENHYFVMGDNRNDSTDSRFFGAVSYDDIAGSVRIIMPYGSNLFVAVWNTLKNYI